MGIKNPAEKSVSLTDLSAFLADYFETPRYAPDEQGGIFRSSTRPVRRLGLALEPTAHLNTWAVENALDALWIHRPWKLDLESLPPDLGILFHHLPFDEHLTLGYNPPLATALQLTAPEPIGYKQAPDRPPRAIGMLGNVTEHDFERWCQTVTDVVGGVESIQAGRAARIGRMAVVGAMNTALVEEAAQRGATLYVTGQYRPSASEAVRQTGISVLAVGHRRSEEWGLRALAQMLGNQWPGLQVVL
ncbi:MAG: Nif3-like dinuclear metal center hexameric protein [Cytophagaceae bacterium]|nr:Nif3-like dinuclear metal center hexameric protein [Cytophagaceae bacterium]